MKKIVVALLSIFLITGCTFQTKPTTSSPNEAQDETMSETVETEENKDPIADPALSLETPVEIVEATVPEEFAESAANDQACLEVPLVKDEEKNIEKSPQKPEVNPPKSSTQNTVQTTSPKPSPSPVQSSKPVTPAPAPAPVVKEKWQIPNLVGTGKNSADAELTSLNTKMSGLGFSSIKITYTEQENAQVEKGIVISQSLAPGTYDEVTQISICISKGAPVVVVSGKDLPNNYPSEFQSGLENEVFNLVNEHRVNNGLSPFIWSNSLHETSRYKSNSMVQHDYFSHSNPQLNGKGSSYLLWELYGVPFNCIGENIASRSGYSSVSAEEIFTQWKNSSGHNENMLNSKFTHIGVGIVYSSKPGSKYGQTKSFISTQHFGGK